MWGFIWPTIRYLGLGLGALTVNHLYVRTYFNIEQAAVDRFVEARNSVIDSAARRLGFEKARPPEPPLDINLLVRKESLKAGINPTLVFALIEHESTNDELAISAKGAIGLMQVMPFHVKTCGLESKSDLANPRKNVPCGVKVLRMALNSQGGDPGRAIQEYNGGLNCVNRCPESIQLSKRVMKTFAKMQ